MQTDENIFSSQANIDTARTQPTVTAWPLISKKGQVADFNTNKVKVEKEFEHTIEKCCKQVYIVTSHWQINPRVNVEWKNKAKQIFVAKEL